MDDILEDDVDGICLGFKAGWRVIAVPTALAVVHHDHYRLKNHLDRAAPREQSNK